MATIDSSCPALLLSHSAVVLLQVVLIMKIGILHSSFSLANKFKHFSQKQRNRGEKIASLLPSHCLALNPSILRPNIP